VTNKRQARWTCLTCGEGGLAPTKPRRDDVRRYCLSCSAKTGRLGEKVAPSLEKKREAQAAKSQERSKKKRARLSEHQQKVTANERLVKRRTKIIETEAARLWKLLKPYHKGKPLPRITITDTRQKRGATGFAYYDGRDITVRLVPFTASGYHEQRSWYVLLHELCHAACPPKVAGDSHHREFYYAIKYTTEKRWKCFISFAKLTGNRWGYSVDDEIQAQLSALRVVKFPLPETRQRPIK
jgi:predicted SprT family Zn-dependent metalloprotease